LPIAQRWNFELKRGAPIAHGRVASTAIEADQESVSVRWPGDTLPGRVFRDVASVVDLTFDSVLLRALKSNVESKTTLESTTCQCPFGSDIRK
jgi:hypothetical protein